MPGDAGAHGRFDDTSQRHSLQWWATTHRPVVASGLAALAAVGLWLRSRR